MKKRIITLSLAAMLVLPALSQAQSVQDNCNAVTGAAVAGRDQANNRIRNIEQAVQRQAETMRTCLERFSDIASRQSMVIGGFNLAPLRNALMDRACNMIQQQVTNAQGQITNAINSQLPQIPTSVSDVFQLPGVASQLPSGVNQILQTPGILPSNNTGAGAAPAPSIWQRMACRVSGDC